MSIQEAIRLNNHAVSFLERDLFNDATVSSCAAMETLQQYQRQQAEDRQEALLREHSTCSIDQFMFDQGIRSSSDDDINEFIYAHGIALPGSTMDLNVVTPVLIFNCALSYQLLASSHRNDAQTSRSHHHRAMQLYRLAYALQNETSHASLFKFVIVNNIGVIHKRLGDSEQASHCFDYLESMFMFLVVYVGRQSHRLVAAARDFWKNVTESMAPAA